VLEIGKVAKEAVMKEGFLAWQYNTIGVSDGITMGHNGEYLLETTTRCMADRFRNAVFTAVP
jgi:dihydroxy-acid dehydratase